MQIYTNILASSRICHTQNKLVGRQPVLEKSVRVHSNSFLSNLLEQAGWLQNYQLRHTLSWYLTPIWCSGLTNCGHLHVLLKCVLHALGHLRSSDSLSPGFVEYFSKVWSMYTECDLNVTSAPFVVVLNWILYRSRYFSTLELDIHSRNTAPIFWHQFGRCMRKCHLNHFREWFTLHSRSNARTRTLKNRHSGNLLGPWK